MASRVIQFSPKLGALICFAKPGEMFEKYSPYSDWQSKDATGIRRAVTRRKAPAGAKIIGGVPHIEEVDAKGRTALRPAKANELIDIDAYRREKHKLLLKTAQPDLDKKLAAAPTEQARVSVRREHLAGIRKQLKQPPSAIHQEIKNIRGSMAGELRTTHRIIGGIRDEAQRRGIPRPIGIPGNRGGHGMERPMMIGEYLPEAVQEARGKLKTMVGENIQRRTSRAERMEGAIRKRIATGIQRTQISEGRTPHPQNILNHKVHEAMEPFRRHVPPSREEYGNIAGYMAKKSEQRIPLKKIERTRSLLDDLRQGTGTHVHQQKVENQLIRSGKIFQSSTPRAAATAAAPRSFPHLRKIGIGAGIAATAAVAGAVALKRRSQQKKGQIAMSARHRPIEFARGDQVLKAIDKISSKKNVIPSMTPEQVLKAIPKRGALSASLIAKIVKKAKVVHQFARGDRMRAILKPDKFQKQLIGGQFPVPVRGSVLAPSFALLMKRKKLLLKAASVHQFARGDIYTAVKTNLIGGTKLINAPKRIKQLTSLRIAAAKGDAAGFRAQSKELGFRKLQVVTHRMNTERDRAAAELRGLRIGARGVRTVSGKLEKANAEVERLQRKVNSRGARIAKLRGERVSPEDAFKNGQRYGETIGSQREAMKSAGARAHFDNELRRVTTEKDAAHAANVREIRSGQNKKIAIGATAGVAAGGVAGYETGKDRKKTTKLGAGIDIIHFDVSPLQNIRNKVQPHPKTTAHDIAVGGIEGGLGVIATDRLIKRFAGEGTPLLRKIAIGTGVGAVATGLVGAAVSAAEKRRRDRQPITTFAVPVTTNRTAVARDRYSKKIHADDMTKAENNYVRSALGGALISTLIKNKTGLPTRRAALIGAGAGALTQAIVRNRTAQSKDQFGDRSYAAKRVDNLPGQAALTGAALIATHKIAGGTKSIREGIKKAAEGIRKARGVRFERTGALIRFERKSKWDPTQETFNVRRRTEDLSRWSGRAIGVIKDIKGEKGVDARGRKKTPEWQKPWVRNAVTVGILGATVAGVRGARGFVHGAAARDLARGAEPGGIAKLSEVIKSGAMRRAAENKVPGFKKASDFFSRAKDEAEVAVRDPLGKLATKIEKAAHDGPRPIKVAPGSTKQSPTGAVTHIPAGSEAAKQAERRREQQVRKKLGKIIRGEGTELSSKSQPIVFSERVNDWDIRDPRGRSARVYAPGSTRRTRRPKRFYERKDNQRVIHQAELGGALIAGTLLAGANRRPIETAQNVAEVAHKVAPGQSALEKLLRETRVRRLSAACDDMIRLGAA